MHLLERQTQLDELARCFQEARKGCGKLLLISAEAGLGKSSLVERFVSEHRRDARTFWGACDGLSTPRALAPVHEIAAQIAQLGSPLTRDGEFGDHLFRILLEELARPERDAVVSRLLRCSPETRELAELVAISPGRTEGWLIESVLGARQPAVDEAGARGLLEVQTDSIGFRHELARRAVLEAIQPERVR